MIPTPSDDDIGSPYEIVLGSHGRDDSTESEHDEEGDEYVSG